MQIQGEHSRATQKSPLILGYLKAKPHCVVAGTINNLMPHLVDTTKDTLNFNLSCQFDKKLMEDCLMICKFYLLLIYRVYRVFITVGLMECLLAKIT